MISSQICYLNGLLLFVTINFTKGTIVVEQQQQKTQKVQIILWKLLDCELPSHENGLEW